ASKTALMGRDPSPRAEQCDIGNRGSADVVTKCCVGYNRTEDLWLKDPHSVGAARHRGLYRTAAGEISAKIDGLTTGEYFSATLFTDIHIRHDFFKLVVGCLCAHHRVGI